MKKLSNIKLLMWLITLTFVISIIVISVYIILAPTTAPADNPNVRVKGDYFLMLFQSCTGIIAMAIPLLLRRKAKVAIPPAMLVAYAIFMYCAIFLGEVRRFYFTVPHWDTLLHTFSGAAICALGFSVVNLLNKSEAVAFSLSPIFVAIFAFCFALTIDVLWEYYEFFMDYFFNTNMQNYALEDGTPFIGKVALLDTMKDLLVDGAGALVAAIAGYISLKYKKGWVERFAVKQIK